MREERGERPGRMWVPSALDEKEKETLNFRLTVLSQNGSCVLPLHVCLSCAENLSPFLNYASVVVIFHFEK